MKGKLRIFSTLLILAFSMILLVGCGKKTDSTTTRKTNPPTQSSETQPGSETQPAQLVDYEVTVTAAIEEGRTVIFHMWNSSKSADVAATVSGLKLTARAADGFESVVVAVLKEGQTELDATWSNKDYQSPDLTFAQRKATWENGQAPQPPQEVEYEVTLTVAPEAGRVVILHLWNASGSTATVTATVDGLKVSAKAQDGFTGGVVAILKADATELGENWINVDAKSGDLTFAERKATWDNAPAPQPQDVEYTFTLPEALEGNPALIAHFWKDGADADVLLTVNGTTAKATAADGFTGAVVVVLKEGETTLGENWANKEYQSVDLTITDNAATVTWKDKPEPVVNVKYEVTLFVAVAEGRTVIFHLWKDGSQDPALDIAATISNLKASVEAADGYDRLVVAILKADKTELGDDWANVEKQSENLTLVERAASWDNTNYANLTIDFKDAGEVGSTYVNAHWAQDYYGANGWTARSGEMRVKQTPAGTKVVNMSSSGKTTARYTYTEGEGVSLGVANYLTIGLSNHYTKKDIKIKIVLLKSDGSSVYALGADGNDGFVAFPATDDLVQLNLSFAKTEVFGIRLVVLDTTSSNSYIYMDKITLQYLAEAYVDDVAPVMLLSDTVKGAQKAGITVKAGTNLTEQLTALLAGIKAYDNVDGLIAVSQSNVNLGGLDIANPATGSYTVTVTVKDAANNEAHVDLSVNVTKTYAFTLPEALEQNAKVIVHLWKAETELQADVEGVLDGTALTVDALAGFDKAVVAVLKSGQTTLGDQWANVAYQSNDLTIGENATVVEWKNKPVEIVDVAYEVTLSVAVLEGRTVIFHLWKDGSEDPALDMTATINNLKASVEAADGYDRLVVAILKAGETTLGDEWANVEHQSDDLTLVERAAEWDNENTNHANLSIDFADAGAVGSTYVNAHWVQDYYTNSGWAVRTGKMLVKQTPGGTKVVNMSSSGKTTARYAYTEGENVSLGVANYLTIGLSNHYTKKDIKVKIVLIKKDGSSVYVLGADGNEGFVAFPATDDLIQLNLSFSEVEVYGIRLVVLDTTGSDSYIYMDKITLQHLAQPYVDNVKPTIMLSSAVKAVAQSGITAKAGANLTEQLTALLAGITAFDNVDGPIAVGQSNVDFGGLNIASAAAGSYTVTVTVKDDAKNATSVQLSVAITSTYNFTLPAALEEGAKVIVHLWESDNTSNAVDVAGVLDGTSLTVEALPDYDRAVVAVLKEGETTLGDDWANVYYQSEDLTINGNTQVVWGVTP